MNVAATNPLLFLAGGILAAAAFFVAPPAVRPFCFGLAAFGIIAAIVVWRIRDSNASEDQIRRLGKRGVATLVSFQPTGQQLGASMRVRVDYDVEPEDGSPAFRFRDLKLYRQPPALGERFDVYYVAAANGAPKCLLGDALPEEHVASQSDTSGHDSVASLERLARMHADGVLSDDEFAEAKRRLLDKL